MSYDINNFEDINELEKSSKILIFGPPGSGKTHYLIERVKNSIKANNYNVLIISFTRAAVQEIQKRLMEDPHIGLIEFFRLKIMTFDQFCTRLIFNNINPGEKYYLRSYENTIKDAITLIGNGRLILGERVVCTLRDDSVINSISQILIDEVQDLKGIRAELTKSLFSYLSNNDNIEEWGFLLLGDMKQEIFGFQDTKGSTFPRTKDFLNFLKEKYSMIIQEYHLNVNFDANPRFECLNLNVKNLISNLYEMIDSKNFNTESISAIKSQLKQNNLITLSGNEDVAKHLKQFFLKNDKTAILFRNNKNAIEFTLWLLSLGYNVKYLLGNTEIILPVWISYLLSREGILTTDNEGIRSIIQKDDLFNSDNIEQKILEKFNIELETSWNYLCLLSGVKIDSLSINVGLLYNNISRRLKELILREAGSHGSNVIISTIHKSKGREYDYVILEDFAINQKSISNREFNEEAKVLYVGATRVCKNFYLLHYGNELYYHLKKTKTRTFRPKNQLVFNKKIIWWVKQTKWFEPKSTLCKTQSDSKELQDYIFNCVNIGDKINIAIGINADSKIESSVIHLKNDFRKIGNMSNSFTEKILKILYYQTKGMKPEMFKWVLGGLRVVALNSEALPLNSEDQVDVPLYYRNIKFWIGFRIAGPIFIHSRERN